MGCTGRNGTFYTRATRWRAEWNLEQVQPDAASSVISLSWLGDDQQRIPQQQSNGRSVAKPAGSEREVKQLACLGETDACFVRLAGNVLVAVQDHLSRERRVPADLDRQMAQSGSRIWKE